jgi:prepilin-type N-terminal cleavage/methylation domain-containing protein
VRKEKPMLTSAHCLRRTAANSRGFSLLEMMLALAILTGVIGVAVDGLTQMQRRSYAENSKTDTVQESRDFVDQMVRDIHDVGYPPGRVQNANPSCTDANPAIAKNVACGIISFSPTLVQYEGDLDGTGTVYRVWLQLQAGAGGKCPCKLQRGVLDKATVLLDPAALPIYFTEVDGVLNSGDGAGGNLGVNLAGPGSYSTYADALVFQAYDMTGGAITSCPTLTNPCSSIRSLQISANVTSSYPDPKTNVFAVYSITSKARVNNAVIDGPPPGP